jgi:hypothetical protein
MLTRIARLFTAGNAQPEHHHPLLDLAIETVGGGIAEASNCAARLAPAIQAACDYFDRQIAGIPQHGPISADNPTAAPSLFPDGTHIRKALGCSLELKESLAGLVRNQHDEIHALLGMRRQRGNESAEPPVFADHTIRCLAPSEKDAREYLRLVALKRLLNNFAAHVDKLRRKQRLLKLEWNIQNLTQTTESTGDMGGYVDAAHELTPEKLLDGLIGWLQTPDTLFRVVTDTASDLPTLYASDRRHWQVSFIRFSAAEGLQALEQESHAHRYILI